MAEYPRNISAPCGSTKLSIAYLPTDRLKPDPSNARQHSKRQIRQIAKSIEMFGFNVPVLIDAKGNVICGHGRLLAAERLGWTEIPAVRLEHLSEIQKKAFMIADNRLAEVAVWDDRLLAEQLKALASVELAFDIETIGFDMGEIDLRIESLAVKNTDASEQVIPEVVGPAVSRVGDFWLLGRHRVLCGDALDEAAQAALMGGERGSAVFADPPYNVPIDGHVSGLGKVRHRVFVMAAGEMTPEAFDSEPDPNDRAASALTFWVALFGEHRRWRHFGYEPGGQDLLYLELAIRGAAREAPKPEPRRPGPPARRHCGTPRIHDGGVLALDNARPAANRRREGSRDPRRFASRQVRHHEARGGAWCGGPWPPPCDMKIAPFVVGGPT